MLNKPQAVLAASRTNPHTCPSLPRFVIVHARHFTLITTLEATETSNLVRRPLQHWRPSSSLGGDLTFRTDCLLSKQGSLGIPSLAGPLR